MGTRIILNLIILNLIQIILTVVIIVLLASCAADTRSPLWLTAIETLPPVEGFSRAGVFTINKKVYVQFCDFQVNQIWMRYNEKTLAWRQSRYNSLGCVEGKKAVGPNEG